MPAFRRYLCFIPLLLTLAFGLYRSLSAPASDFAGYYYGGRALMNRDFAGAYDMTQLNDRIAAAGHRNVLISYAPFPPFTSLVFAPFLLLPMGVAKVVFNGLSIGLFLFSLARITRYLSTPPWVVVALPAIFFVPLLNNPGFGQSYLLLFSLLAEGYLASRRRQRVLSSLLWAAAILFKLFPAFLFLYLLAQRRYRDTVYLAIGCALLLLLSVGINGFPAWNFYVFTIIPRMNHGELNDSFTYVFQSGFMLFKRAFQYDQLLNPQPLTDNPWFLTAGLAIFKALILTPAIIITRRVGKDDFASFAIWIVATTLISPNGSSYSLVLLILPLLAIASPLSPSGALVAAALLLAAACVIPVTRFGAFPLWLHFPRLYLLLLFYFLLCQSQRPRVSPTMSLPLVIALTALFFALDIRGNLPEKDASAYVLSSEAHLFVDSFAVRENHLVYTWRDDKGRHEEKTDFLVHSLTEDGISLDNNQIWYGGKQLTASADRKAKPALVNGDLIIYLSDKHRGFDFFTLRKIRTDGELPDAAGVPGSSR